MQLRIDKRDSIPIREWEEFLASARRAGATDTTLVEEEVYEPDPDIVTGFKIDVQPPEGAQRSPQAVMIPAALLHDLLYVAREVASSDGDFRGLESTARKTLDAVSDHFLEPVLGPNPWADE